MNISKRYLFYLAGTLWIFAGIMVFSIGLRALVRSWAPWEALVAATIFLLFYFLVFAPLVKKHECRIASDERAQMPWWAFFDKQGYLFIAAMMPLGIALRLSGLVPQCFFAFFYTGIGAALLLCGLQFFHVGFRHRKAAVLSKGR